MRSAADRLQFLVRFTQVSLDTLSPEGLGEIREELIMFMGFTTTKSPWSSFEAMNFIYGMPTGHYPPEDKEIHAWQCAARTLLDTLVAHRVTKYRAQ